MVHWIFGFFSGIYQATGLRPEFALSIILLTLFFVMRKFVKSHQKWEDEDAFSNETLEANYSGRAAAYHSKSYYRNFLKVIVGVLGVLMVFSLLGGLWSLAAGLMTL